MAKRDLTEVLRGVTRFGRMTFLEEAAPHIGPLREYRMALCRCDCGAVKAVAAAKLNNGKTLSCGCLARDIARRVQTKHGGHGSPEYKSWRAMLSRCANPNNPDFHSYGGRGIAVCDRWRDFAAFSADMGKRPSANHTLERQNVNGGYEPGNCYWATSAEQGSNKRDTRRLEIDGETLTVKAWAKRSGISYGTIISRIYAGWAAKEAVFTPPLSAVQRLAIAQKARWSGQPAKSQRKAS